MLGALGPETRLGVILALANILLAAAAFAEPMLFGALIDKLSVVQGAGQCLVEQTVYTEEGQLVTGSFMDYAMPRADIAPLFVYEDASIPATTNPLGVKGCGEAGCAGSLTSIMNAVVDALSEYGIKHIDMPASPARVWQAIQNAQGAQNRQ